MCRDYERERSWRAYRKLIDAEYERQRRPVLRVVSPAGDTEPNYFTSATTALTKPAPIVRAAADADGCELARASWWFTPASFKGSYGDWRKKLSTFNARSEGIAKSSTFRKAFASQRCLVPASGWYEWTGEKYPKTKWRFFLGDHEPIMIAGIWDRFENSDPKNPGTLDTFALVTHAAGPGVDKYHDRSPVILAADRWADWLDASNDNPLSLIPPASAANAYQVEYVSGPQPVHS